MAGVDVPMGWPDDFVTAVAAHRDELAWLAIDVEPAGTTRHLRLRMTDRHVVETYPAGALRLWGLRSTGYKRAVGLDVRSALVDQVIAACGPLGELASDGLTGCNDDELDAFLCAVIARAVCLGCTFAPSTEQLDVAKREGWIHLPSCSLPEVASTLGLEPDSSESSA